MITIQINGKTYTPRSESFGNSIIDGITLGDFIEVKEDKESSTRGILGNSLTEEVIVPEFKYEYSCFNFPQKLGTQVPDIGVQVEKITKWIHSQSNK